MIPAEITFEIREDEGNSGFWCAKAVGLPIFTQGKDWPELRAMTREAVLCYFDGEKPQSVKL